VFYLNSNLENSSSLNVKLCQSDTISKIVFEFIRFKYHNIFKVRKTRKIFQSGIMGICSKIRIVYGVVTVSDKGQIAIPADLRRDLDIKQGDKLFVLKRRDEAGFTLIKLEKIDELMYKIQEDELFFSRENNEK